MKYILPLILIIVSSCSHSEMCIPTPLKPIKTDIEIQEIITVGDTLTISEKTNSEKHHPKRKLNKAKYLSIQIPKEKHESAEKNKKFIYGKGRNK